MCTCVCEDERASSSITLCIIFSDKVWTEPRAFSFLRLTGWEVSRIVLSPPSPGTMGICSCTLHFTWMLGNKTKVLMLVWQEIHQLRYLLSPWCYVVISLLKFGHMATSLLKSPSFFFIRSPNWPFLSISFAKQSLDHHFSQGPSTPSALQLYHLTAPPDSIWPPVLSSVPQLRLTLKSIALNLLILSTLLSRGCIAMSGGNFDCHTWVGPVLLTSDVCKPRMALDILWYTGEPSTQGWSFLKCQQCGAWEVLTSLWLCHSGSSRHWFISSFSIVSSLPRL